MVYLWYFFFFKQKTAYEMRISDWSSDVCSSDLAHAQNAGRVEHPHRPAAAATAADRTATRAGRHVASTAGDAADAVRGGRGADHRAADLRSEESRVGKESVSPCRSRVSPYHKKKTKSKHTEANHRTKKQK